MTTGIEATRSAVRCHRCAGRFESWSRLEFLECVAPERLQSFVTSWDSTRRIEVRRCPLCGAALARLASMPLQ